jgi:hypothetical protein
MIQRLWLLQQQTKEKPTDISVSPFCGTHSFGWITLSRSLWKQGRNEGRKDTVSLTLIHPSSIRFQNAIECGERKKER